MGSCAKPGLLLAALLLTPLIADGTVLEVPSQYAHIQAAIDVAAPGDTVVVAEGTYSGHGFHHIDFCGKPLLLRSAVGPERTILSGARAFYFHSGETSQSIVDGFTITNAYVSDGMGGGIICLNGTAPTIVNCLIAHNGCVGTVGGRGGGIACIDGAHPVLMGCTITANEAHCDLGGEDGGGIYCSGGAAVELMRCIIWGNCGGDIIAGGASSSVSLECCAIDPEGYGGTGQITFIGDNVFEPPQFCAPQPCSVGVANPENFLLSIESPCLPWRSPCGELIGALSLGCPMTDNRERAWPVTRARIFLEAIRPQPAHTAAVIRLNVTHAADLLVRIFDVSGTLVRDLHAGPVHQGRHEVTWDLTDASDRSVPSGVYWVDCESGSGRDGDRMLVVATR